MRTCERRPRFNFDCQSVIFLEHFDSCLRLFVITGLYFPDDLLNFAIKNVKRLAKNISSV